MHLQANRMDLLSDFRLGPARPSCSFKISDCTNFALAPWAQVGEGDPQYSFTASSCESFTKEEKSMLLHQGISSEIAPEGTCTK